MNLYTLLDSNTCRALYANTLSACKAEAAKLSLCAEVRMEFAIADWEGNIVATAVREPRSKRQSDRMKWVRNGSSRDLVVPLP